MKRREFLAVSGAAGLLPLAAATAAGSQTTGTRDYLELRVYHIDHEKQREENWQKFIKDAAWERLKAMDEYADKKILSGITNLFLKPAPCSQI